MKIEIEFPDAVLDAIAAKVADRLKPVILGLTTAPAKADELMSVGQLATYLGVSKDWVYQRTAKIEIPIATKAGRLLRFRKAAIDAWLALAAVPNLAALSALSPPGGRGIGIPVARQTDLRKRPVTGAVK